MTEGRKTAIFALVAGAVALLAWATTNRVSTEHTDVRGLIGTTLFQKFTDPLEAASMKILRYNTNKEEYDEFEVTKDRNTGLWTIPSHESYPADATKQMADAATLFVGLRVIDVASERRTDQALFGVLEPNTQKESEGGEGVGMLVQLRDEKGETLVDAIIGKDSDGNKRFLRIPSEDVIYVCELDTAPLTTDFKNWIESDLLQLSANDVEKLGVRDYQILPTTQGMVMTRNYEADLLFDTASGKWNAERIMDFTADPPAPRVLGLEEQINGSKLTEIRDALDNLKIVDVAKKPAGLAADLKGDKSKLGNDVLRSLQTRGFIPNPNQKEGDVVDFLSRNGELIVTLRDGVQYLLRFGSSASTELSSDEDSDSGETVSVNPYLLVTVRLDESKYPQPVLAKVPESVEELKAIEALNNAIQESSLPNAPAESNPGAPEEAADENATIGDEASNAESVNDESASGEAAETPDAANEGAESQPSEDSQSSNATRVSGKLVSTSQESDDEKSPEGQADSEPAQSEPVSETPVENSNEASSEAPASEPSAGESSSAELTDEEWAEKLEVTRERITKSNTRLIEARDEKIAAARSKVNELNRRFADWYYVISESDLNRLKVTLDQLVQPKTAADAGVPPGGQFPGLGLPGMQQ